MAFSPFFIGKEAYVITYKNVSSAGRQHDLDQFVCHARGYAEWKAFTTAVLFPFLNSTPTFKTATPTSRTQLKQQLMREQLQEQERREAELKQQQVERRAPSNTSALKVPLSIQSVDVPPQVLQVSTRRCLPLFLVPLAAVCSLWGSEICGRDCGV